MKHSAALWPQRAKGGTLKDQYFQHKNGDRSRANIAALGLCKTSNTEIKEQEKKSMLNEVLILLHEKCHADTSCVERSAVKAIWKTGSKALIKLNQPCDEETNSTPTFCHIWQLAIYSHMAITGE